MTARILIEERIIEKLNLLGYQLDSTVENFIQGLNLFDLLVLVQQVNQLENIMDEETPGMVEIKVTEQELGLLQQLCLF